jgi:hypothetical protein
VIDVQADSVAQLGGEGGVVGEFEQMYAMGLQAMRPPNSLHRADADATDLAIAAAVQCVASPGGSFPVSAMTRSITVVANGGLPEGAFCRARARARLPA